MIIKNKRSGKKYRLIQSENLARLYNIDEKEFNIFGKLNFMTIDLKKDKTILLKDFDIIKQ